MRTELKNTEIIYNFNTDYDDSQVEKFMNTVEFNYDSINYKQ